MTLCRHLNVLFNEKKYFGCLLLKLKKAENISSTYVKMFEWSGVLYVFTLNIFPGFCAYKGDQDTDPSLDVLREAEDMWDPGGRAGTGFCHKTRV